MSISTPPSSSFGTTISSGIQDLSAILSLFGTEQCELHVGSALRGGGHGGYLYAAITPLSIFGSLGPAKAAFSIMLLGFGPHTLEHMGFEAKGDVMTLATLTGNRYQAETRLINLLHRHYISDVQNVRVERPVIARWHFPLRPWNFKLLAASLLVACLGVTPYIHFSVLKRTTFPALAIFFPWCRVVGGLLCVFPGQLLLQYRIEKILKQRILFTGINDLPPMPGGRPLKVPTQFIRWDENHTSESCLFSLYDFVRSPKAETENAKPFIRYLAQVLDLDPESSAGDTATRLKPYIFNTREWYFMQLALLSGILMTLIGYAGCFTIVQNSSIPKDTYTWLSVEVALASIRLIVWGVNPLHDESDGMWLYLDCDKKISFQDTLGSEESKGKVFKIIPEWTFLRALTAHSGPVDIPGIPRIFGVQHLYSWIPREQGPGRLCLILKRAPGTLARASETILCTMNDAQGLEFHHADVISKPGYAVQRARLEDEHELMRAPSEFMVEVFDHYHYISTRMAGISVPIRTSWTLRESSVRVDSAGSDANINTDRGDLEKGTPAETWEKIKEDVERMLSGKPLTYQVFRTFREIIADNSAPLGLHQQISAYFSQYTDRICQELSRLHNGPNLSEGYNEQWRIYSTGTLALNRLFRPFNSDLARRYPDGTGKHNLLIKTMETGRLALNRLLKPFGCHIARRQRGGIDKDDLRIENVAFGKWNTNVLQVLSTRLRVDTATSSAVDGALAGFISWQNTGGISLIAGGVRGSNFFILTSPSVGAIGISGTLTRHAARTVVYLRPNMERTLVSFQDRDVGSHMPPISLHEFAPQYSLSDTTRGRLEDAGLDTTEALFGTSQSSLVRQGLKIGEIAELKGALVRYLCDNGVSEKIDQDRLFPESISTAELRLPVAEFVAQYELGEEMRGLLDNLAFETTAGLVAASRSDLVDSGVKIGQIAELQVALKRFLSINGVLANIGGDLLVPQAGGIIADVPRVTVSELSEEYLLSEAITSTLSASVFETAAGILAACEADLRGAGLKMGQIAVLKRALKDFLKEHGLYSKEK